MDASNVEFDIKLSQDRASRVGRPLTEELEKRVSSDEMRQIRMNMQNALISSSFDLNPTINIMLKRLYELSSSQDEFTSICNNIFNDNELSDILNSSEINIDNDTNISYNEYIESGFDKIKEAFQDCVVSGDDTETVTFTREELNALVEIMPTVNYVLEQRNQNDISHDDNILIDSLEFSGMDDIFDSLDGNNRVNSDSFVQSSDMFNFDKFLEDSASHCHMSTEEMFNTLCEYFNNIDEDSEEKYVGNAEAEHEINSDNEVDFSGHGDFDIPMENSGEGDVSSKKESTDKSQNKTKEKLEQNFARADKYNNRNYKTEEEFLEKPLTEQIKLVLQADKVVNGGPEKNDFTLNKLSEKYKRALVRYDNNVEEKAKRSGKSLNEVSNSYQKMMSRVNHILIVSHDDYKTANIYKTTKQVMNTTKELMANNKKLEKSEQSI